MSATPGEATVAASWPSASERKPWLGRKSPWLIVVGVVLLATGLGFGVYELLASGKTRPARLSNNVGPTGLYTVPRRDLSSQTQLSATLGWAGDYAVVDEAQGTVTAVAAIGQVVSQGQVLYRVNQAPIAVLYGQIPAYRTLSSGLTGADVAELNTDLVDLGQATSTEIPSGNDDFTYWTEVAVEKLEAALGETPTGILSLGQVVFLPGPVRITGVPGQLGGPAQAGQVIMQGTSTNREVSIALEASDQSEVAVGDKVVITLPDGTTTPGAISSVGTVASASSGTGTSASGPTVTVVVSPSDPAATGAWDDAPVNVTITTGTVSNVLVVPIDALLARPGGGFAVEEVGVHGSHRLVPVTLGLSDDADGLVQVSGSRLAAGQHVVVPRL